MQYPAEKLRIGGPPVDNVAIDEAGNKSLNLLAGVAVVIGFIVSWFSLKSVKLVAIVISAGIYSSILSLSLVWYCGSPVDAILFTMPSLVYVATTSGRFTFRTTIAMCALKGIGRRRRRPCFEARCAATQPGHGNNCGRPGNTLLH